MRRFIILQLSVILSFVAAAGVFICPISVLAADSLQVAAPVTHAPDTLYVIPAGPLAGSFTHDARVSVTDTIAGWAHIQVEGWVPVRAVMDRLNAQPNVLQPATSVEKPSKKKDEVRQCEAITSKGTRCTRNAMKGSRFCWQHQMR